MQRTLKRDNWTNSEVIDIINGLMMEPDCNDISWNEVVKNIVESFEDFRKNPNDPTEYGAKAYCVETGEIVHIGTMPPR